MVNMANSADVYMGFSPLEFPPGGADGEAAAAGGGRGGGGGSRGGGGGGEGRGKGGRKDEFRRGFRVESEIREVRKGLLVVGWLVC